MDDAILTLEAAAALLGCKSSEVLQLVRRGEMLGLMIPGRGWFVHRGDVEDRLQA